MASSSHYVNESSSQYIVTVQTRVEELQGAEETERRSKEKAAKEAAAEAAAEKRKATLARVERMKEWDDEEVRMLEKALEKFPQVRTALLFGVLGLELKKACRYSGSTQTAFAS